MKNRINLAAANRALAIHGESIGAADLVRASVPVNARNRARAAALSQHPVNRVLELFGEELGASDLRNMDSRAQSVGMLDRDFELRAINRSLAVHGEELAADVWGVADNAHEVDMDAVNRALGLYGEELADEDICGPVASLLDIDAVNRALESIGEELAEEDLEPASVIDRFAGERFRPCPQQFVMRRPSRSAVNRSLAIHGERV